MIPPFPHPAWRYRGSPSFPPSIADTPPRGRSETRSVRTKHSPPCSPLRERESAPASLRSNSPAPSIPRSESREAIAQNYSPEMRSLDSQEESPPVPSRFSGYIPTPELRGSPEESPMLPDTHEEKSWFMPHPRHARGSPASPARSTVPLEELAPPFRSIADRSPTQFPSPDLGWCPDEEGRPASITTTPPRGRSETRSIRTASSLPRSTQSQKKTATASERSNSPAPSGSIPRSAITRNYSPEMRSLDSREESPRLPDAHQETGWFMPQPRHARRASPTRSYTSVRNAEQKTPAFQAPDIPYDSPASSNAQLKRSPPDSHRRSRNFSRSPSRVRSISRPPSRFSPMSPVQSTRPPSVHAPIQNPVLLQALAQQLTDITNDPRLSRTSLNEMNAVTKKLLPELAQLTQAISQLAAKVDVIAGNVDREDVSDRLTA
jgi:hypothetical protein